MTSNRPLRKRKKPTAIEVESFLALVLEPMKFSGACKNRQAAPCWKAEKAQHVLDCSVASRLRRQAKCLDGWKCKFWDRRTGLYIFEKDAIWSSQLGFCALHLESHLTACGTTRFTTLSMV